MQKLWLKNFEFHINPGTWNTAQDLVQAGAVKNLREVEKHFWVALVEDTEASFEVEVMITPHKIKAFTCECWAEGRRLMCPHIGAVLFKTRQFLEQRAERREQQVAQQKKEEPGRLTVPAVLETASPEELAEFVRAYARRDRDFALALKTWFAGSVSGTENPYTLLLDAALPTAPRQGARTLRDAEIRRLRKTLDDLRLQMAAAQEQGNARTLFQIAAALLQKLTPLLEKTAETRREQLEQYCLDALQRLTDLPPEHQSPELRENLQLFIFDLATRMLLPAELERPATRFLARAATDDRLFERIRTLFDQTPFPAPRPVLHLFLSALARRNMPEAVVRVLEDYTQEPFRLKEAIAALYYLQDWPAVLLAADHFLEKNLFNTGQRREVEDLALLAAEKAGDRKRQLAYLRLRYRQNGHPDLLQRLRTLAGAAWPAERAQLEKNLRDAANRPQLAALLAAENDLPALSALLTDQDDLDLLRRYEDLYWPERSDFVREKYVAVLSNYLLEHFGRQAAHYVREQLGDLLRKGRLELALDIVRTLTTAFADRPSLPEELAEMFPKAKRGSVLSPRIG